MMKSTRGRTSAPSLDRPIASLPLKRALGLGMILALVCAACGNSGGHLSAESLLRYSSSLRSEAAEGALLAQDAASGKTTRTYTLEHSSDLYKAVSSAEVTLQATGTEPAFEAQLRQLTILAGRVSADLQRLGSASRDEDRALARDLLALALASEEIGKGLA